MRYDTNYSILLVLVLLLVVLLLLVVVVVLLLACTAFFVVQTLVFQMLGSVLIISIRKKQQYRGSQTPEPPLGFT